MLGAGDHKVIGRLYIGFSLVFAPAGGRRRGHLGIERLDTSGFDILASDTAGQVLSFHLVADPCCSSRR